MKIKNLIPLSIITAVNAALAIWYYSKAYYQAELLHKLDRALARHALFFTELPDGNVHIGMEQHFSSLPCTKCHAGEKDGPCDACLGRGYRVF